MNTNPENIHLDSEGKKTMIGEYNDVFIQCNSNEMRLQVILQKATFKQTFILCFSFLDCSQPGLIPPCLWVRGTLTVRRRN